MHSVFYGLTPVYIANIVTSVTHLPGSAHLRSAKNGDYNTPRVLSSFGQRSFSVSGPDACRAEKDCSMEQSFSGEILGVKISPSPLPPQNPLDRKIGNSGYELYSTPATVFLGSLEALL